MSKVQLWQIIPEYRNIHFVGRDLQPVVKVIKKFPFMTLPSGKACVAANKYLIKVSERKSEGTVKQYASSISALVRYCYEHKVDFIDLTSDHFSELMQIQRDEKTNSLTPKRVSNTLISNARRWLDFLDFIAKENDDSTFLPARILASKRVRNVRKGKTIVKQEVWWHCSFDTPSPLKKRKPISKASIDALRSAIINVTSDKALIRRREALLRGLESTGGRVAELVELKVEDVLKAEEMKNPMLKLITKKNDSGYRFIPILHQDLRALIKYIEIHRSKLIEDTIGESNDHGFVFISVKTGIKLTAKYLSDEVGNLRRAAGIEEKACAQMFRHRFITKLFISLIKEFNASNKSELKLALLDGSIFKKKVQQYTNHKSLDSLDHYIDLAFAELVDVDGVENRVRQRMAYEAFDRGLDELESKLKDGMVVSEYLEELQSLRTAMQKDLDALSG
ncbi:site-specific integrase [Vibrio parahaemolyticus]|nr:site-specific integrase [Vibrio parahaemolyticus]